MTIKTKIATTICFVGLLLFPVFVNAINLTKVEFSYLYKDSPLKMRYKIAKKDDVYKLLVYLNLKKVTKNDEVQNFTLVSQKKFSSTKESVIEPLTNLTSTSGSTMVYDLTFQADPEHSYVVIKLNFLSNPYVFDIPVGEGLAFPLPDFVFKTEKLSQVAIKMSDSLIFEKMGRGAGKYYGFLYKDHFSPAFPPFSEEIPDANKRFVIESVNPTNYGYKVPTANYLYYFQNDTSSQMGASFYAHEEYFPNTKSVDELIDPLIYVATDREYKNLDVARNKKKAFDDFWLSIIPSQKLAARTLRNYFRRVKQANTLFSSYKKGWKTDMGMIYILYGAPDQVFKDEEGETWEYNNYDGKVKFNFDKVPNLFTQYHYSLNRSKNYSGIWFSQVERWRKGDS